jgi:hypothetical protein
VRDNERLEDLQFYMKRSMLTGTSLRQHQEGVLLHYNELQSRSAEVEAMTSNFEQRVAGPVAKAGLRAKPGPKKKGGTNGTTGRGKANHNEWTSGEISVENPTPVMAPRGGRKKDEKDNLSTAMEL